MMMRVAVCALFASAGQCAMVGQGAEQRATLEDGAMSSESSSMSSASSGGDDPMENITSMAKEASDSAASKGIAVGGAQQSPAQALKAVAAKAEKDACVVPAQAAAEVSSNYDEEEKFAAEEKTIEQEFKTVTTAHTTCATKADSPAAKKAMDAGTRAKQLSQDYVLAQTEAKKTIMVAQMKQKKAALMKKVAVASYKKAAQEAIADVNKKVGVAAAVGKVGGFVPSKVAEAKQEVSKAAKQEKEAIQMQKSIKIESSDTKAKADCAAKSAADASAKLANTANQMMADIDSNLNGGCSKGCGR